MKTLEMGIILHRDPIGEPGRGFIYRGLWETVKERSVSQASLSMGEELGRRAPIIGTLKDMSRKALDMENLSPYSSFMR